uniref:cytochrome c oxidase assembly protein COX16 homolog, mitochondrial isoform X2 n=1 Tax=Myxine glutinosa TaxID=7769 RepID=UPI00358FD135
MNFKAFFRGKTFRYGVPMLVLIIGGSVGLKEFTTIRYEAMARRTKIDPALDALFDKAKRKTTLEDHYEVTIVGAVEPALQPIGQRQSVHTYIPIYA